MDIDLIRKKLNRSENDHRRDLVSVNVTRARASSASSKLNLLHGAFNKEVERVSRLSKNVNRRADISGVNSSSRSLLDPLRRINSELRRARDTQEGAQRCFNQSSSRAASSKVQVGCIADMVRMLKRKNERRMEARAQDDVGELFLQRISSKHKSSQMVSDTIRLRSLPDNEGVELERAVATSLPLSTQSIAIVPSTKTMDQSIPNSTGTVPFSTSATGHVKENCSVVSSSRITAVEAPLAGPGQTLAFSVDLKGGENLTVQLRGGNGAPVQASVIAQSESTTQSLHRDRARLIERLRSAGVQVEKIEILSPREGVDLENNSDASARIMRSRGSRDEDEYLES